MSGGCICADAILRMLHFNEAASILKKRETDDSASPYKILVLDAFSKAIIAPLVGVQDLRQKGGVTLHLIIDAAREPIPDVPAVYFVRATAANIERIIEVRILNLVPADPNCHSKAQPRLRNMMLPGALPCTIGGALGKSKSCLATYLLHQIQRVCKM